MAALVVKVTCGTERVETLMQAFTVAATGLASGLEVSVWLTGDATLHALPGTDDVVIPHSPPLSQLRDAVLAGGTLTVCAQCARRRELEEPDLLPGARIAGAAAFVAEATAPDATALVY
ncbi:DsrE family protein [Demequina gelatinilytica]|uniref:DsrE family protein n=1 Tax=Demequina gelatinilytica TaxID=1638980 RepID=UPI000784C029|nr:DsrE family protein [Demequina gelatinilytica]